MNTFEQATGLASPKGRASATRPGQPHLFHYPLVARESCFGCPLHDFSKRLVHENSCTQVRHQARWEIDGELRIHPLMKVCSDQQTIDALVEEQSRQWLEFMAECTRRAGS